MVNFEKSLKKIMQSFQEVHDFAEGNFKQAVEDLVIHFLELAKSSRDCNDIICLTKKWISLQTIQKILDKQYALADEEAKHAYYSAEWDDIERFAKPGSKTQNMAYYKKYLFSQWFIYGW